MVFYLCTGPKLGWNPTCFGGRGVKLRDHMCLPGKDDSEYPPWGTPTGRTQASSFCVDFIEESLQLCGGVLQLNTMVCNTQISLLDRWHKTLFINNPSWNTGNLENRALKLGSTVEKFWNTIDGVLTFITTKIFLGGYTTFNVQLKYNCITQMICF